MLTVAAHIPGVYYDVLEATIDDDDFNVDSRDDSMEKKLSAEVSRFSKMSFVEE